MVDFFAATRRASKNHLVLWRFSFLGRQTVDGYQVSLISLVEHTAGASALRLCNCGNRPRCSIVAGMGSRTRLIRVRWFPAQATALHGDSIGRAMFGNWDRLVINRQSLRPNQLSMRAAASQSARLLIPCSQPDGSVFQKSACSLRVHAV
jgi:hypothetical protein